MELTHHLQRLFQVGTSNYMPLCMYAGRTLFVISLASEFCLTPERASLETGKIAVENLFLLPGVQRRTRGEELEIPEIFRQNCKCQFPIEI